MQDFKKQFILAQLAYAASRGIDPAYVCQLSGVNYKAFNNEAKPGLTAHQIEALWKNLSHTTNDPSFGLHFGESMQIAALGVIGQIVQTSSTISDALTNAGALIGLITDGFSMQMQHGQNYFAIHLISSRNLKEAFPFTYRHIADYLMVFIVHELDGLLMQRIQPQAVYFPYSIKEQHEYTRIFRCPVHTKSHELVIELKNHYLSQPILSANYDLQNHLLKQISFLLKDTSEEGSLQTRIFNYLLTNSYLYTLSLEAVAANFNVSPRTLQRKLKEEGSSFLQIVDDVRRRLAEHYLASGNFSVKDVAYTLGYNEQSAFIRAFKRWTGVTPSKLRPVQRMLLLEG